MWIRPGISIRLALFFSLGDYSVPGHPGNFSIFGLQDLIPEERHDPGHIRMIGCPHLPEMRINKDQDVKLTYGPKGIGLDFLFFRMRRTSESLGKYFKHADDWAHSRVLVQEIRVESYHVAAAADPGILLREWRLSGLHNFPAENTGFLQLWLHRNHLATKPDLVHAHWAILFLLKSLLFRDRERELDQQHSHHWLTSPLPPWWLRETRAMQLLPPKKPCVGRGEGGRGRGKK